MKLSQTVCILLSLKEMCGYEVLFIVEICERLVAYRV